VGGAAPRHRAAAAHLRTAIHWWACCLRQSRALTRQTGPPARSRVFLLNVAAVGEADTQPGRSSWCCCRPKYYQARRCLTRTDAGSHWSPMPPRRLAATTCSTCVSRSSSQVVPSAISPTSVPLRVRQALLRSPGLRARTRGLVAWYLSHLHPARPRVAAACSTSSASSARFGHRRLHRASSWRASRPPDSRPCSRTALGSRSIPRSCLALRGRPVRAIPAIHTQ
jgi:hypothetical protein